MWDLLRLLPSRRRLLVGEQSTGGMFEEGGDSFRTTIRGSTGPPEIGRWWKSRKTLTTCIANEFCAWSALDEV